MDNIYKRTVPERFLSIIFYGRFKLLHASRDFKIFSVLSKKYNFNSCWLCHNFDKKCLLNIESKRSWSVSIYQQYLPIDEADF